MIYSLTEPSPIQGWRLVLEGPWGSGKTTSLLPLLGIHKLLGIPEPMKLRVLSLDPNTWPVLGNTEARLSSIRTTGSMAMLHAMFTKAQSLDNEMIQKSDFRKSREGILVKLVERIMNFVDTHQVNHGSIDSWGTDTVFGLDGLTGLTDVIAQGNLGPKPAWSQPDYQRVMNCIQQFLLQITQNCFCHVVLIAHVEYEENELGVRFIMPSTAGRKLAPKIGRGFSDVVLTEVKDKVFSWTTAKAGADLVARHLPRGSGLSPDITQLFTTPATKDGLGPCGWLARGGIISPVVPPEWKEPEYYKA